MEERLLSKLKVEYNFIFSYLVAKYTSSSSDNGDIFQLDSVYPTQAHMHGQQIETKIHVKIAIGFKMFFNVLTV